MVPPAQILAQLLKNRYYLKHLGKKLLLYTVVTDSMCCYRITEEDELEEVDFSEVIKLLKQNAADYISDIDGMFQAAQYLVSPLETPVKFIQGEYFLTQAQEQIKKDLLRGLEPAFPGTFFHLTGRPGTGKTLLLYDIAKTISRQGKTLLIHCGKLTEGQEKINQELENLSIVSVGQVKSNALFLDEYNYILVDEVHRIQETQYWEICASVDRNGQSCIFSSDPEQILSNAERKRNIVQKITELKPKKEFILSEKLRANRELYSFIDRMRNLNHKQDAAVRYQNIYLNYANTTGEAQALIEYYKGKGFVFINYSKPHFANSPYACYEGDYDTHHVVGQEFDKVVMLMDDSFYYDELGVLSGVPHPNPDFLYPNLFYQGVTRVREVLAVIVVNAPVLFGQIARIVE